MALHHSKKPKAPPSRAHNGGKMPEREVIVPTEKEKPPEKTGQLKRDVYYPYSIRNGKLLKKVKTDDGPNKEIVLSNRIEVLEIRQDIDTNQVFITLGYSYHGRDLTYEIPRRTLTKLRMPDLLDRGVDVTEDNVKDVLRFLRLQDQQAPLFSYHSSLGWGHQEGSKIFKHYHAIGCESVYRGPLNIEPLGTMEAWNEVIRSEVVGHTPLELALVAGFSAAVASLIQKDIAMEVLILHLYGNSTMGKTSATRVAASPFGFPHTQDGGLIHTWNGTTNAVMGLIANSHGLPLCFDEASMQGGDFTTLIYMLAGGKDKTRLDKESVLRKTAEWSGTVISTAEHSLTTKAKQNIGIQMRLLELGNVAWTRSAVNADALKEGLMQNYGHAGPAFVRHLLNIGTEEVLKVWRSWKDALLAQADPNDQFASRLSDKLAILLATASLANEALSLGLNVDAIREMLVHSVSDTVEQRDLGLKAYEVFQECVVRHKANFAEEDTEFNGRELWGKVIPGRGNRGEQVYILPSVLQEWMDEAGFEDTNVVRQTWRERGWLNSESGRLTRKKSLSGSETRVYVIHMPKPFNNLTPPAVRARKIKQQTKPQSNTMDLDF